RQTRAHADSVRSGHALRGTRAECSIRGAGRREDRLHSGRGQRGQSAEAARVSGRGSSLARLAPARRRLYTSPMPSVLVVKDRVSRRGRPGEWLRGGGGNVAGPPAGPRAAGGLGSGSAWTSC